jgi:hypothetical protein
MRKKEQLKYLYSSLFENKKLNNYIVNEIRNYVRELKENDREKLKIELGVYSSEDLVQWIVNFMKAYSQKNIDGAIQKKAKSNNSKEKGKKSVAKGKKSVEKSGKKLVEKSGKKLVEKSGKKLVVKKEKSKAKVEKSNEMKSKKTSITKTKTSITKTKTSEKKSVGKKEPLAVENKQNFASEKKDLKPSEVSGLLAVTSLEKKGRFFYQNEKYAFGFFS